MIIDGRYGDGRPLKIRGINDSTGGRRYALESSGNLFDELPSIVQVTESPPAVETPGMIFNKEAIDKQVQGMLEKGDYDSAGRILNIVKSAYFATKSTFNPITAEHNPLDADNSALEKEILEAMTRVRARWRRRTPPPMIGKKGDFTDPIYVATVIGNQIKALVDSSPEHKQLLEDSETRKRLFERFSKANDYLFHNYWLACDLGSIGTPEPPKGCPVCYEENAIDEYLNFTGNRVKTIRPRHVDSRKALDLFDMDRFRKPVSLNGYKDGDELG